MDSMLDIRIQKLQEQWTAARREAAKAADALEAAVQQRDALGERLMDLIAVRDSK